MNGLTRANLLDAPQGPHELRRRRHDPHREHRPEDPGPCFLLEQYTGGKFVRIYPKKAGTFDCTSSNSVKIKADLIG